MGLGEAKRGSSQPPSPATPLQPTQSSLTILKMQIRLSHFATQNPLVASHFTEVSIRGSYSLPAFSPGTAPLQLYAASHIPELPGALLSPPPLTLQVSLGRTSVESLARLDPLTLGNLQFLPSLTLKPHGNSSVTGLYPPLENKFRECRNSSSYIINTQ